MTKNVIKYFPYEQLEFDKDNPRLPHSVVNSMNEGDVIDWMLKDASIIELMGSIGEKGFFPGEPLLGIQDLKIPEKYIIVEGNRRLTAIKLLHHPEFAKRKSASIKIVADEAKIKPRELPVLIFEERKEILDYLGFKHITSVKPWSALAKAKYLRELQEQYKGSNISITEQHRQLAKAIGSRSDYVKDLLIGLDLYDKIYENSYFDIRGLNEETIDFGVYYNALKYSNIPKFLGINKNDNTPTRDLNTERLEEMTRWVSEKDSQGRTRLGESRNLSKLNAIVLESEAVALFRDGRTLDDALLYTEEPYELFKKSISDSLYSLRDAQKNFHHVSEPGETDFKTLNELSKIANDLKDLVQFKISKSKQGIA